ncbi:Allergen Act d 3 [Bienertia sinuspersici]
MLKLIASLVVLLLASTLNVSFGGLLPNGNFEKAPSPNQLSGTKVEGKYAIPNWEVSGYVEYIKTGTKQQDMVLIVPEGKHAVRLGTNASIKQKVGAQKGKFYALTFSFARTCSQEEVLNVTITPSSKGHSGLLPLQTVYTSVGFDSYAWGFRAEADVIEITLHNPGHLDFGQGPYVFHSSSWGVLIPPNIEDSHSPLPAWRIESLKAVKYIDSLHFTVPEGQRAIELVGGKESVIAQTIRTQPGRMYALTFIVGDAGVGCVGPLAIEAFAAKATTKVVYNSKGKGGFTRGKLVFKADKSTTSIRFLSSFYTMTIDGSMCGPVLDDVKVLHAHSYRNHIIKA